jgi:hypothetical protein
MTTTMTTTTTAPSLALALRREAAYREARDFALRVAGFARAGMLSRRSGWEAAKDAAERWHELQRALELAGITSEAAARAAGLGVWIDPILGVGVEVGEDGR